MRVLWLGRAHYQPVLLLQQRLRAQVLAGGEETILFVEHPSVITLGHRATAWHRVKHDPQVLGRGVDFV